MGRLSTAQLCKAVQSWARGASSFARTTQEGHAPKASYKYEEVRGAKSYGWGGMQGEWLPDGVTAPKFLELITNHVSSRAAAFQGREA